MSDKYERFIGWYLRLNGYFTIDNFIVHAADDPTRISNDRIGNYTEIDILGVRMPYSREVTGCLYVANHEPLVNESERRFDVVIAEVKSGNDNRPNPVWRNGDNPIPIEYIVRFIGLHECDDEISEIASTLLSRYTYEEDDKCHIRYIVFSKVANPHWQSQGVTYITYDDIIQFLVEVRGQCWVHSLALVSHHYMSNGTCSSGKYSK